MLMQERDNLDHRLKEEREEMDHIIEMEWVWLDSENMQSRVHMDRKWEEEIHGKDINNVLLEEKVHCYFLFPLHSTTKKYSFSI
jgi:hypothetical protein